MSFLTKLFWVVSFIASVAFPALGFVLTFYTILWTGFEFIAVIIVDTIRGARNGN